VAQLLFLFITIPFVELMLLLMLSERMGWAATLGLVVFTGIVGASLAKHQGLRTIQKLQNEVSSGQMPAAALMDAGMILVKVTTVNFEDVARRNENVVDGEVVQPRTQPADSTRLES
jgi:UPF0716 family protein affecting phage T7 exclusion